MDPSHTNLIRQTQICIQRLERLSADSIWAHRASGLRRALMAQLGDGNSPVATKRLEELLVIGFDILTKAAQEIPADRK